jgi:hypothetical protein
MLSVHVAQMVTPWALVIGAMRYAFVVVSWLLPWLSGALPTRYSAKVVAAAQGIVLVVASAQLFAQQIAAALVVAALAALLWSFGKSVTWLWRARAVHTAVTAPARLGARPMSELASESMSQRLRPARELASAPSAQCPAKPTERSEGVR